MNSCHRYLLREVQPNKQAWSELPQVRRVTIINHRLMKQEMKLLSCAVNTFRLWSNISKVSLFELNHVHKYTQKIIRLNAKNVWKMIRFDNPNLEEFRLSLKHTGILATLVLNVWGVATNIWFIFSVQYFCTYLYLFVLDHPGRVTIKTKEIVLFLPP